MRAVVGGAGAWPGRAVLVVSALALLALAGCRRAGDASTLVLNGRIEAPVVDLAARVTGRIVEFRVREGDRVAPGDVLYRLDIGDLAVAVERDRRGVELAEARLRDLAEGSRAPEIAAVASEVAEREAAVALAQRELRRQEQLLARRVGTPRDVDRARTDLDRAEAALRATQERLALVREGFRHWQTVQARIEVERARRVLEATETLAREAEVRAPAAGVVLHRLAEPGQVLSAGQPGVTLAFADRLYVRTFIPEPRLGQVRQGQAVTVRVDAFADRRFPARITEISPDAEFTPKAVETREERVNLVYAAKADLDEGWNAPLVPGQPAEVLVPLAGQMPGGGTSSGGGSATAGPPR